MTKPILVTSAAGGTQGRTGRHVSEMLLERGARVRAFVRQIDERSDRLKSLGAEIFVGDFLDVRVRRTGRQGRLGDLLCLSGPGRTGRRDRGDGPCGAQAWCFPARQSRDVSVVDRRADAAHAAELSLRTGFRVGRRRSAASPRHGVLRERRASCRREPAGARRDPPAAWQRKHHPAVDLGRRRRADRRGPADGPSSRPPERPIPSSAAPSPSRRSSATFARVLNRDIHYEEITDEQWRSEVLARGWNAHAVEHLSSLWKSLRAASLSAEAARFAVTDTIEKIGGAKPKTFEQFVREQQSELAAPPAAVAQRPSREDRS